MPASPQVENGHIDIANEIAEALMRTNLSAYQSRVLWALWRKTYGWHKKEDWISLSQFVELTGISKGHVSRTLTELRKRNMVTNSGNNLAFNKNYTQWRELPKGERGYQSGQIVTNSGNGVTNSGKKVTNSGDHKRNSTKETITKETLQKKNGNFPFQEIIDYLNLKTGKNFKASSRHARKHIKARHAEGHTLEDFKRVIDNKCSQWLSNPEMAAYLRPETLFGTKFESYLNEIIHPLTGKVSSTTMKNLGVLQNWHAPGSGENAAEEP